MRFLFDLYSCQNDSRLRGIGRYTHQLFNGMMRLRHGHDLIGMANGVFHPETGTVRRDLHPAAFPGPFSTYTYPDLTAFSCGADTHEGVANAVINHAYQAAMPDVVLYTTPFEGWAERGIVPVPSSDVPFTLRATILYDFIPWLFPEQYLDRLPGFRRRYERRLAGLRQFDLLLAISEATRQDAIRILGIAPERVVNISGAPSDIFRPMPFDERAKKKMDGFGIKKPFVLYTGNADYRKNLSGMLNAYARLPKSLRETHQLVLNQVGADLEAFRQGARALGLADDEVVVTGHVTDEELICLYSHCKVFVFPSLYEGFGLPILEAMACGAPVIAADNSSIPEVVGRTDFLFDASSHADIAALLEKVLIQDGLRKEIASHGLERAKLFNWDRTAGLAWKAVEAAVSERKSVSSRPCLPYLPKLRIAIVCPLESAHPSVNASLGGMTSLVEQFEIDVFIEEGRTFDAPLLKAAFPIYPHTQLLSRRDRYATVIYHVADSEAHAYMLPLLEQYAGVVFLHDAKLPNAAAASASDIAYGHGLQSLIRHGEDQAASRSLTFLHRVMEAAQCLMVPESIDAKALRRLRRGAWIAPLTVVPYGRPEEFAAAYAQAIRAAAAADDAHTIRRIADVLEEGPLDEAVLDAVASHLQHNRKIRRHARLLIDVTQLAKSDANSGIQRVVKKIAYELGRMSSDELAMPVDFVQLADGKLHRAVKVIAAIFGVDPAGIPEAQMDAHHGDTLLMIDSSWEQYPDFLSVFQSVHAAGGRIVTVVYDLIPLNLPQVCAAGLVKVFQKWFGLAAQHSDMLLCISQAVAADVATYLESNPQGSAPLPEVSHWRLGADLSADLRLADIRPQIRDMVADTHSPLFIMVGTIEPRKGHDFVLDAFDSLWASGVDARLCIAGQEGWHVEATVKRIRMHPLLHKKLFFVEKFADAEINLCYASATALIAASMAEGFGLPIVEAALHEVPVLASDIPVFREVACEGARYFSLSDPAHLADAVTEMMTMPAEERLAMARKIKILTWRDSAAELLKAIRLQ